MRRTLQRIIINQNHNTQFGIIGCRLQSRSSFTHEEGIYCMGFEHNAKRNKKKEMFNVYS